MLPHATAKLYHILLSAQPLNTPSAGGKRKNENAKSFFLHELLGFTLFFSLDGLLSFDGFLLLVSSPVPGRLPGGLFNTCVMGSENKKFEFLFYRARRLRSDSFADDNIFARSNVKIKMQKRITK